MRIVHSFLLLSCSAVSVMALDFGVSDIPKPSYSDTVTATRDTAETVDAHNARTKREKEAEADRAKEKEDRQKEKEADKAKEKEAIDAATARRLAEEKETADAVEARRVAAEKDKEAANPKKDAAKTAPAAANNGEVKPTPPPAAKVPAKK